MANSDEEGHGDGGGEPLDCFAAVGKRREANAMEQGEADAALRV
jgi:hypothetical protein